jgi:uncharacterized protein YndB with AHSA1/START domain
VTVGQSWTVELEHRVGGSPETVFEYFTDPEKYRRWKGIDAELDARPGGIYRVTMAPEVWVRGEYVVVESPHRLVMTWGFEGSPMLPRGLARVPPGSSTVEFTFVPDGDGTIIRVRHSGLPTEEAQFAHKLGWNSYLPRLAAVRAGRDPGEHPVIAMAEVLFGRDAAVEESPGKV